MRGLHHTADEPRPSLPGARSSVPSSDPAGVSATHAEQPDSRPDGATPLASPAGQSGHLPPDLTVHAPDVAAPFRAFAGAMVRELAANRHKGDRAGWQQMNGREAVNEVLYHAAKLSYALRQYEQGDGPADKILEFAADIGNCAMMVADVAGVLVPRSPGGFPEHANWENEDLIAMARGEADARG